MQRRAFFQIGLRLFGVALQLRDFPQQSKGFRDTLHILVRTVEAERLLEVGTRPRLSRCARSARPKSRCPQAIHTGLPAS